jgi:imidazolonepropionase-like amidohydrolase
LASAIVPAPGDTAVEAKGRTLTPGLIDAHRHLMFETIAQIAAIAAEIGFVNLAAGKDADDMLMRSVTSARDMGGPVFGLKHAIDQGLMLGPRIWPSGDSAYQSGVMATSACPRTCRPGRATSPTARAMRGDDRRQPRQPRQRAPAGSRNTRARCLADCRRDATLPAIAAFIGRFDPSPKPAICPRHCRCITLGLSSFH